MCPPFIGLLLEVVGTLRFAHPTIYSLISSPGFFTTSR